MFLGENFVCCVTLIRQAKKYAWPRRELNLWPLECLADAPPTELRV